MPYIFRTTLFVYIILFSVGCSNTPVENSSEANVKAGNQKEPVIPVFSDYRAAIEAMRSNKDKNMISRETIEPEKRNDFKGLRYFEPDSSWIFKATLELLKPEKIVFKTTDTRAPEYYRFCKMSFIRNGDKMILYGYVDKIASPESIFVPFKDATSNKETYGGGRYMDLTYNGERTMILLDFNYAYNPYCHYNHNYSCPLVPEENVLGVPVFAGEKKLYE